MQLSFDTATTNAAKQARILHVTGLLAERQALLAGVGGLMLADLCFLCFLCFADSNRRLCFLWEASSDPLSKSAACAAPCGGAGPLEGS